MDNVDRTVCKHFDVTEEDVLRSYVKTTGLSETEVEWSGLTVRMCDTGGQRSERGKWVRVFPQVTCAVFVVSLSEYDQVLVEASDQNRMQESLNLFDAVCNSKWFVSTPIVLLLNKVDHFAEKIRRTPISRYFPEYQGGEDFESTVRYVTDVFLQLDRRTGPRKLFAHLTCALDSHDTRSLLSNLCDKLVAAAKVDQDPQTKDWTPLVRLRPSTK